MAFEKFLTLENVERLTTKLQNGILKKGLQALNPDLLSAAKMKEKLIDLGLSKFSSKIVPAIIYKAH